VTATNYNYIDVDNTKILLYKFILVTMRLFFVLLTYSLLLILLLVLHLHFIVSV